MKSLSMIFSVSLMIGSFSCLGSLITSRNSAIRSTLGRGRADPTGGDTMTTTFDLTWLSIERARYESLFTEWQTSAARLHRWRFGGQSTRIWSKSPRTMPPPNGA